MTPIKYTVTVMYRDRKIVSDPIPGSKETFDVGHSSVAEWITNALAKNEPFSVRSEGSTYVCHPRHVEFVQLTIIEEGERTDDTTKVYKLTPR